MSGLTSGYRDVNYRANLEFQRQHFSSVWQSYEHRPKAPEQGAEKEGGGGREPVWKKAGICILCSREQIAELLDEVFHIRDREVVQDVKLCRTVYLKHSYTENSRTDAGRETMYLERTMPYLFSENTVILTDQLGGQQLEETCVVLLLREPDFFESTRLTGREAIRCGALEDLKKELSELKVTYPLADYIKLRERRPASAVEVITGDQKSFLALELVEKLMDREKTEAWNGDTVKTFTGYLLAEYERNAMNLLKAYIRDGAFAANFLFVQIYLTLREREKERFGRYVEDELLPSCTAVLKRPESRMALNNRLMENGKLRKADILVSDSLTLFGQRLKKANEEVQP